MIKDTKPISMAETKKIAESLEENDKKKKLKSFIKKFSKITPDNAEKLRQEMESLGFLKLKKENIVKIIDMLPEDESDLNKIFTDVNLDEDEKNKILEIVKKHK